VGEYHQHSFDRHEARLPGGTVNDERRREARGGRAPSVQPAWYTSTVARSSRQGRFLLLLALTAGALWGGFSYAVLWNDTPIVVTRAFFDSAAGLMALFPVRVVLWAIHVVETRIVHHSFAFPDNHRWIGVLAALVGAGLLGVPAYLLLRLRDRRRSGGPGRLRARVGEVQGA
jgi:hypothetical protein